MGQKIKIIVSKLLQMSVLNKSVNNKAANKSVEPGWLECKL